MKVASLIRKFIVGAALALAPAASFAGIFISVGFAPPALPVYTQPICPGDGYLWNPGYWAYGDEGYYWVPGVWVEPPSVGLLWTPGYWGFNNGAYLFNAGYWGPHVGFYGGINYGFGFGGSGFYGGEWRGGHFAYNTAYSHVDNTVIHNTYVNRTTINNTTINNSHTSFNGGQGGVAARPSAQEANYQHENHIPPTAQQQSHVQAARAIPANFAKANGGHPAMAAIQRPGATNTAIPARGAEGRGLENARGQTVNQRAQNQQGRVAQGVNSGQMTPHETRNVEGRDASINHETQADRSANGGRLTPQEHQQINQRQNNVSRSIDQDKHNDAARPAPQARPQAQQARPQPQQARPQPQQARPESRPQPAPRPENHGGEHGHR